MIGGLPGKWTLKQHVLDFLQFIMFDFDLFLYAISYVDDKDLSGITHTDCHVHSVCE